MHLPFSVYRGWMTVAAIANVATSLVAANWGGGGISPEEGTVHMTGVAILVSAIVIRRRGDVAYGLVIIWALVGSLVKQQETPNVVTTAGIGAAIVGLATSIKAVTVYRGRS